MKTHEIEFRYETNKELEEFKIPQASEDFAWIERGGNRLFPVEMRTSHLFFAIRMIWNHSAPDHMRIKPYQKYVFGPVYTNEYMLSAIANLLRELSKRDDLTPYFIECLEHMKSCVSMD
jgi:hypothetical protein